MKLAKKAMASAGIAMTAGALIASVTTTPASAAPAASTIKLCQDSYNSSNRCDYEYYAFPNLTNGSDGNFQDSVSYISNYSGRTWCLFTDNNYGGIQGVFQDNYTWNTLSYPYNDSISSGRPC
ncbi:hypothetical protein OKJ48_09780 [Streptomyces kunmingensis]|uniref:Peptidase inhibitor family I36 n=1 Tax=Streptomyces kunmingensis TaxID=68225 RepID=A0ABU6C772_9ACTN|nr:hypothetical protein [Streptomyces kunmingensis]MEB3960534.1 hypothetical protein [Streptomyces kunmingensis]